MSLERTYRRLIRAYPPAYRERRGEEILGTLLDAAKPGQTRPTLSDVTDLIGGATRERLGLHAVPAFAAGLRLAAPVALAVATGLATTDWLEGIRTQSASLVAGAWLAATLCWLIWPTTGRIPPLVAWFVTAIATQIAGVGDTSTVDGDARFVPTLLWGLIAVAAMGRRAATIERLGVPVAVAGLLVATAHHLPASSPRLLYPEWSWSIWLVPAVALAAGTLWLAWRRDTSGLWAALVLLVPVPATLPSFALSWEPPVPTLAWGLLTGLVDVALLAALVIAMVAVAAWPAATGDDPPTRPRAGWRVLDGIGAIGLGTAGGLATLCLLGTALTLDRSTNPLLWIDGLTLADVGCGLVVVVAVTANRLAASFQRAALALAAAALLTSVYTGLPLLSSRPQIGALSLLTIVALATRRRHGHTRGTLTAAAGTVMLLGALIRLNLRGTGLSTITEVHLAQDWFLPIAAGVALAPIAWYAALVIVRADTGWANAVVVLAASLLWCLMVAGPANDSRVLAGILATASVLTLGVRLINRRFTNRRFIGRSFVGRAGSGGAESDVAALPH